MYLAISLNFWLSVLSFSSRIFLRKSTLVIIIIATVMSFGTANTDKSLSVSDQQLTTIAHLAQRKLITESQARPHNLRRLVGHANLYDKILVIYQSDPEQPPDYDSDGSEEDLPEYSPEMLEQTEVILEKEEAWRNDVAASPGTVVEIGGGGLAKIAVEEVEIIDEVD